MLITLTQREMLFAQLAGETRETARSTAGHHHIAGLDMDKDASGTTQHIFGAIGELIVAKVLGLYWSGPTEELGAPDVGVAADKTEVRTTMSPTGELIIRPGDSDDLRYYLVAPTTDPNQFNLVGWMLAGEAKQHPEWLEGRKGRDAAYFVPQWNLHQVHPRWSPEGYDPEVNAFPPPAALKSMSPDFLAQFSVLV